MFVQPSYYEMVAVALKEINTGSDRVAGIVTPWRKWLHRTLVRRSSRKAM
jgi:hypothetical protein